MQASEPGKCSAKKYFLSSTFFTNYSGSIGVFERLDSADKDIPCLHHLYDNSSSRFNPAEMYQSAADVPECEHQKRSSRRALRRARTAAPQMGVIRAGWKH